MSRLSKERICLALVLVARHLIESPAVLPPLPPTTAFDGSCRLVVALDAQYLAELILVLGLGEEAVEVIAEGVDVEELGITHAGCIDGRAVLEVVVPAELLEAVLLRRAQNLLPPLPSAPLLCGLALALKLEAVLAVVVHVCLALALLLRAARVRGLLHGLFWLAGPAEGELLGLRGEGIGFRCGIGLRAIVLVWVVGVEQDFLRLFGESGRVGPGVLLLVL